MKSKKILAAALSLAVCASTFSSVIAASPSDYDAQTYESLGYISSDPDGQFDLAVIANNDVRIYGDAMYIKGSVYSNGNIYVGDGSGNKIDGLFISGTEGSLDVNENNNTSWQCDGYIHVNDNGTRDGITSDSSKPEYMGAIMDKDTSFECDYNTFNIPEISNNLGTIEVNIYGNEAAGNQARTISEDTRIEAISTINGTALTVDTTNGDVNLVIDSINNAINPGIKVVGNNNANIYIGNVSTLSNLMINYNTNTWPAVMEGNTESTHIYMTGDDIVLNSGRIAADLTVDAASIEISGSTQLTGDISTNASDFTITGGETSVTGIVCAPNADSNIVGSGTLYGQLHTNTLTINGAGMIIYNADAAVEPTDATPEPTSIPEATPTPEATAAPEATATPDVVLPSGTEPQMRDFKYAYIFGYEPGYNEETGETIVEMAPNDSVTVEQVCAMIARTMSQIAPNELSGVNISDYPNINMTSGSWSAKGVAYLASKHAFDGIANVPYWAEITRGEVAKLIALGLNTDPVYADFAKDFTDIENHIYKPYIDIVSGRGYMSGDGNGTFNPDRIMTRAEFCSLFNNITDRADYDLVDIDGNEVTPATYNIVDLDNAADWERQACMLATSAFVPTGYSMRIDLQVRAENIRNRLDDYNGQMEH